MAKSYLTLERARGAPADRVLVLPEDRANPEAMAGIYRALGRPETPDGYGVSVPDTAPDVAKAFAADLPKELHALGAPKPVVDKLVEMINTHSTNAVKAENDRAAADQAQVDAFIKAEWGDDADFIRGEVINLMKDAAGDQFDALREELAGNLGKSPILFKYLASQVKARVEGQPLPPGGKGGGFGGRMSVSDAQAAKNAFLADKTKQEAWRTKGHPLHNDAVAEFNRYNEIIISGNKKS